MRSPSSFLSSFVGIEFRQGHGALRPWACWPELTQGPVETEIGSLFYLQKVILFVYFKISAMYLVNVF